MQFSSHDTKTSTERELPVRRFHPTFDTEIDRHWCGGDPALTHILNSYTLLVPGNEGYYIRTLRKCTPLLQDANLRAQMDDFVRQEGQHGVGHRRSWRMLDRQGYRYQGFVKAVDRFAYGVVERLTPLKLRVAMVACIEHANAYIGHEFLAQQLLAHSDPDMRALFEWHFAEEIEHKGVSFDALQAVAPGYLTRALGAVLTLPLFYLLLSIGAMRLAKQDGSLWSAKFWRGAWQHLWSRDRMIQRTLGHIARYLRPGFHPWQQDDAALAQATIERWSSRLSAVGPVAEPATPYDERHAAAAAQQALEPEVAPYANSTVRTVVTEEITVVPQEIAVANAPLAPITAHSPVSSAARIEGGSMNVSYDFNLRASNDQFTRNWYEEDNRTYWSVMHQLAATVDNPPRPCFHGSLMTEMRAFQSTVIERERHRASDDIAHFVLSSASGVFNLGGDLELFARLIRNRDRAGLSAYAELCVRGVHTYHDGFGPQVHTIALVQGDALGGGFEAALSCNTIVAEEGIQLGLPEALFDLFPGMGAYQFLKRRAGGAIAEKLIMSGQLFDSRTLQEMGVIDMVVPKGQGLSAVEDLIRRNRRNPHTRLALNRIRAWSEPVALDDLLRTTELWVDTALQLGEKQLRTMDRLVRAQQSRHGANAESDANRLSA